MPDLRDTLKTATAQAEAQAAQLADALASVEKLLIANSTLQSDVAARTAERNAFRAASDQKSIEVEGYKDEIARLKGANKPQPLPPIVIGDELIDLGAQALVT